MQLMAAEAVNLIACKPEISVRRNYLGVLRWARLPVLIRVVLDPIHLDDYTLVMGKEQQEVHSLTKKVSTGPKLLDRVWVVVQIDLWNKGR